MQIQYQIFKEKNLKIHKFSGLFSIEFYNAYMIEIINNTEWKYVKRVITDLRECTFNMNLEDIEKLVKFRDTVVKSTYRNIFIVNNPSSTAVVHLYQQDLMKKKYDYEYCSTVNHAIELLELEEFNEEIVFAINNLKNKFEIK